MRDKIHCKNCSLFKTNSRFVCGIGDIKLGVMFIGEAPGYFEDVQGKPFVGRSGKLLDRLLNEIGLSRNDIYITNLVKCRPPENRDPSEAEIECCIDILRSEVRKVHPKIIVTLGRISSKRLIDPDIKITRDHGIFTLKKNIWMMPTLHPSAVLRNMGHLPEVQQDFLKLKSKILEL